MGDKLWGCYQVTGYGRGEVSRMCLIEMLVYLEGPGRAPLGWYAVSPHRHVARRGQEGLETSVSPQFLESPVPSTLAKLIVPVDHALLLHRLVSFLRVASLSAELQGENQGTLEDRVMPPAS